MNKPRTPVLLLFTAPLLIVLHSLPAMADDVSTTPPSQQAASPSASVPLAGVQAAGGQAEVAKTQALINSALSGDRDAVITLREMGQPAVDALCARQDGLQQRLASTTNVPQAPQLLSQMARLNEVANQVGGARYCTSSRLFWHTDLEQAKKAAIESGKPILSLHMLGKLTDEFSCANSRFFRTTLYANKEVSDFLRDNYVMHWHSVRPVPRVTIDFGDGRKLHRTLTGNSAHYVLTSDGDVVDVLPGLYGPAAFSKLIRRDHGWATNLQEQSDPGVRQRFLTEFHTFALKQLADSWKGDLAKVEAEVAAHKALAEESNNVGNGNQTPRVAVVAPVAAVLAVGKGRVEMPILARIMPEFPGLEAKTTDDLWIQIAELHHNETELDQSSIELIRSEHPVAEIAGGRAMTKKLQEDPLLKIVRGLRTSTALDTVKNEYQLHRRAHQWLAEGEGGDLASLNERVYAELFLTPSSDPWLGLVDPAVYTALENGGVEVQSGE